MALISRRGVDVNSHEGTRNEMIYSLRLIRGTQSSLSISTKKIFVKFWYSRKRDNIETGIVWDKRAFQFPFEKDLKNASKVK